MTGEKRSSIFYSIRGFEEVKRLEKWEMKFPPISSLEDTQSPESNFKKCTAFALFSNQSLCMKVFSVKILTG